MKPIYIERFVNIPSIVFKELNENNNIWVNNFKARDECFMSPVPLEYTYGDKYKNTYHSISMHRLVKHYMKKLNNKFETEYNVSFLNRYIDQHKHLGWHADDSPEMDKNHPIAVISVGQAREIWWKPIGYKGEIPKKNKQLLANGSLFIMPIGFQELYLHRIPKHGSECGTRISLTYRRYLL